MHDKEALNGRSETTNIDRGTGTECMYQLNSKQHVVSPSLALQPQASDLHVQLAEVYPPTARQPNSSLLSCFCGSLPACMRSRSANIVAITKSTSEPVLTEAELQHLHSPHQPKPLRALSDHLCRAAHHCGETAP